MSNATRTVVTAAAVLAELLKISDFQKEGSQTAQLRQVITTKSYYPSKQASNSLTDSLFSNEDFGYEEQEFIGTENRVAFMNVPMGITLEELQAKLDANPKSRIYKILSNHPVLTDSQKYAISQGLRTKSEFANSQVARYGEGAENAGELVLDSMGKPQYRATFFSASGKADIDLRTADPEDFYTTDEISAEMMGHIPQASFVEETFEALSENAGQTV